MIVESIATKDCWPADSVERWPVERLIEYASNPRTHSPEQISQIAASMRQWGWTNPILIDEAGTIIAGHGRLMAAKQLGYGSVPVMVARGWSDAQKRAYVIADNQLALNSAWDTDLLSIELDELRDLHFDLDLLGFSSAELNHLIGTPNTAPTEADQESANQGTGAVTCPNCGHEFVPVVEKDL